MDKIDIESAIADLVGSQDFLDDFKKALSEVRDPEKKVKIMETLLGYQISKMKTIEPTSEDRFRPIQINYTVTDKKTTVSNGDDT